MGGRTVTLCRHTPRGGQGGRRLLWAFSADDLAVLLGMPAWKVRREVAAGRIDPTDLEAICRLWLLRGGSAA